MRNRKGRKSEGIRMIAIGCLSLTVLPLIGLAVGGYVGGLDAAIWSAIGGLAAAALVCGVGAMALWKARR
jgi:hypothetical protein